MTSDKIRKVKCEIPQSDFIPPVDGLIALNYSRDQISEALEFKRIAREGAVFLTHLDLADKIYEHIRILELALEEL